MHRLASLAVFLLVVVVTAAVAGQFVGGEWYQDMNQPSWNPSAMVMASAWAVVYVLMAVSAWMVWDAMRSLAIQMIFLPGLNHKLQLDAKHADHVLWQIITKTTLWFNWVVYLYGSGFQPR